MTDLFLKIVNMSISASYIILAVVIARLLLKKAPKWITVLLWGMVAFRLVCPFSIESILSLIPKAETVSPEIMMMREPAVDTGIPVVNEVVNPVIQQSFTPEPVASANPLQIIIPIISVVWLVGVVAMVIYAFVSYWVLLKKIGAAFRLRDNIYQSESIKSPFVVGVIRPKIYLPFNTTERNTEFFIAHESAHIKRLDHLWKPLGFTLLAVYWFNPLMWVAYVLLCKDIELACDEKVIANYDNVQRADYSQALLSCSMNRKLITACPIAFGEVSVKDRIKSVLSYKKPALWIIIVAIIAIIATAVCFLTDPVSEKGADDTPENEIDIELYNAAKEALIQLDDDTKSNLERFLPPEHDNWWAKIDDSSMKVTGSIRCYGAFKNCIVLFRYGQINAGNSASAAGYDFIESSGFAFYLYHKGDKENIYSLIEGFENGCITEEEVGLVKERHEAVKKYIKSYVGEEKEYTSEQPIEEQGVIVQLEGDLLKQVNNAFGYKEKSSLASNNLRCYGNFKNCVVLFKEHELATQMPEKIMVAGYTFSQSHSFGMFGVCDGIRYKIEEAYELGYLSKEEVGLAHVRYLAFERNNIK